MAKDKSGIIPFDLLTDFKKDFPHAFETLDKVAAAKGRDVPDWHERCDIPVAATLALVEFEQLPAGIQAIMGALTAALYSWRKYKQVYTFNPDLAAEIEEQPLDKIPMEVLYSLPYNCVWIEIDGAKEGFFVWFEWGIWGDRKNQMELHFLGINDNLGYKSQYILHLTQKGTITDGVNEMIRRSPELNITAEEAYYMQSQIRKLLNLLLYICAQNAEIEENPQQKQITKRTAESVKKPTDKFRELQKWDVGFKLGKAIRAYKQSEQDFSPVPPTLSSAEEGKTRQRPRPHIRRGHYHHFWTGSDKDGSKKIILKWIAPTYINGDLDKIIPTVTKVKK